MPSAPVGGYDELIYRDPGVVPAASSRRLREATVLVAGCGSTGGAVVDPLARLGAERFVLADAGACAPDGPDRLITGQQDIGRNRAVVCTRHVREVNPQACTRVVIDGVQRSNVQESVASCDVVIDGVDGSESACWPAKYALHEAAARLRRPVISGYDLDGTRYLRLYDYRRARAPFDGVVRREQIAVDGIRGLLRRVVPLRVVPVEVPEVARRSVATAEESTSQLLDESMRFGALAARMAVDVLDGRPVRRHTVVPAHRAVGTRRPPSGP